MNSTAHTGAAGELFCCQYFLSMGLEVFRNLAYTGPVDLMLYNPANGKSVPVDVKSTRSQYVRADGTRNLGTKCQLRPDGVYQIAYVHGEAAPCLPEGFWEALGMETSYE